jgi:NADPH-dependent ferric siderophore reductase
MVQQTPAPRVRPRPNFRAAVVSRVQRLTPRLTRVTLAGPGLDGLEPNGPAEHIRLWFPPEGAEEPVLPRWGEEGPLPIEEGAPRPVSRVYTPRRWDARRRELEIDFVLHDESDGPGSNWVKTAREGSKLVVTGPSGPYRGIAGGDRFLLASDHAGLPAVATILEALPPEAAAEVLIEVASEAEELPLESPAPFEVTWLHAGEDAAPGRLLEQKLREREIDAGRRVFVACEAGVMRDIRRQLLLERGLPRESIHTHGYWKAGEANHPDHDLGQDVG